jgi:hypothetical protein
MISGSNTPLTENPGKQSPWELRLCRLESGNRSTLFAGAMPGQTESIPGPTPIPTVTATEEPSEPGLVASEVIHFKPEIWFRLQHQRCQKHFSDTQENDGSLEYSPHIAGSIDSNPTLATRSGNRKETIAIECDLIE